MESRLSDRDAILRSKANLRLLFLTATSLTLFSLIVITTNLFIPFIFSITLYFLLNPIVNFFERQGYSRILGAFIATATFFAPFTIISYSVISMAIQDLASLETSLPQLATNTHNWIIDFEARLAEKIDITYDINITEYVVDFLESLSAIFIQISPNIVSNTLWALILTPILTFFLLNDALSIRNAILNLSPNRFFESSYEIAHLIEDKISSYIIAKIIEALIVGLLALIALGVFGFPYSALLALIAGVTNIVPYFGPIIGFAPIILIPILDPQYAHLLYPAILMSLTINVIDLALIFPILVSKIIDLHPLFVLFSVLIGSHLGGPLGILVAIPIAAIIKIVLMQVLGAGLK